VNAPKIEILTMEDCPRTAETIAFVRSVAAELVPESPVTHTAVKDEGHARRLTFSGYPTVRVNGACLDGRRDHDAPPTRKPYGDVTLPPRWLLEAAILRALAPRSYLFLCVANSARSQMAEGIARSLAPADVTVASAGSEPAGVRPEAVQVLAEIGIDIASHHAKSVDDIPPAGVEAVITLCAEEVCPTWLGNAHRVHWGLPDPAAADSAGDLDAFRATRDELKRRLTVLFP